MSQTQFANTDTYLFSSESVTEGHPDKICDRISDAILDEVLAHDPHGRVACEVFAALGVIIISGEITTTHIFDAAHVARNVLRDTGYINPDFGMCADTCAIMVSLNKQSPDIAQGVNESKDREQGAGDQGLMFGYACDETPELMPLPISLAHKLTQRLADVRKQGILPWVRPDGKSQVTVAYVNGKPTNVTSIVISVQHDPTIAQEAIKKAILSDVCLPVCGAYLTDQTKYYINATGKFVIGGPQGDTGLTGRKIIVDTYGGMGRHGGGCFSGKDPSKVDRSAAYMARHIAKNIVAAGIAKRCEVQLAYCIGVAEPVSVYVNTFGTSQYATKTLETAVRKIFPLKPAAITTYLDLQRPIYYKTAAYGHFGRNEATFTWEKLNKIDELKMVLQ